MTHEASGKLLELAADTLRDLHEAATPGDWAYRPDPFDDWGIVKSPPDRPEGFEYDLRCVLAQFRDPRRLDDDVLAEHRSAKTDPWQANAELVVYLRNHTPAIIGLLENLSTPSPDLKADNAALREALQLIADERGHCRTCRTLASDANCTECDCSYPCWEPMDAPAFARAVLQATGPRP